LTELVNLADSTVVRSANAFCVALRDGRLPLEGDHPLGLYRDDCRHLRGYELRLGGRPARLLIASDAAGTGAVYELTNEEIALEDGRTLPLQSLRVRVERRMLNSAMTDRITLHSYAREPAEIDVDLNFDADFRPMLEVRGGVRPIRREVRREARGNALAFAATGRDGRERTTTITCPAAEPDPAGALRARVPLEPGGEAGLEVHIDLAERDGGQAARRGPVAPATPDDRHEPAAPPAAAEAEAWLAERPHVEVDDALVGRVLRRSLLDLRLLTSELDGRRYYAAGIPWYATLFGRDSIIAALDMLAFDPSIAADTLRVLAARLGTRVDDERDEEPGKVIHELRGGELAAAGATPFARYYGTVDATPLLLCLLAAHARWAGTLDLFRELRSAVEAALRWIDEHGDLDGDGLLEYRRRAPGGLENQGWKDSWDAIVDEDGSLLAAPMALVEAQGYAHAAARRLAPLFERDGDATRAAGLRADAERRAAAIDRFWLDDRGFYAMALDAGKRPSRALASNQGHLLWAGAIPHERAGAVRTALMGSGLYSAWGVRTLSAHERAFNPVGYHLGTVWPHDNALCAAGLRRYGFDDAFLRIFDGLLDAAGGFHDQRLPELFAGFDRADYEDPVPYPVACVPQAWAAGALPSMLVSGLGLVPDAFAGTLSIVRPSLPRQVSRLALRGLRVGEARVDLVFERLGTRRETVALTDAQIAGPLRVALEIDRGPGPAGAR